MPPHPSRLERLQLLTDAALAHLELEGLLDALLDRTRELLEVDTCAILLLDEETNELVARAARGIEEEVQRGVRIPVGRGFAGRVAADREPVFLPDVDHADVLNPILREKGIKSMLGVPLIAEHRVLGVMHVGSLTPRVFGTEETELLQLAGDRAALAIEHARAFAAEQRARQRLENLQLVTDTALAHLELDPLLSVILPRVRDVLAADTCAVLLLADDGRELVARAAIGIEEEVEQGVRVPVGQGFAGKVAATRSPVVLDRIDTSNVVNPILLQKRITSMLGVPLLARGDVIGVMHVGSLSFRSFDKDDVELLSLVAERVALAIERAKLHQEMLALDQLKLNFVAIASHELRTPATSVYGALATLVERGDELDEQTRAELLRMAFEQGERLRRLVEELLDLSRLDASAINADPRPLVLRSFLQEVVDHTVPPDADFTLDVPADLAVVADQLVLDRVISNLLINAIRYGKGPIVLAAEQRDSYLRIRVEDSGEGIPADLRPRLFERFARGDEASGSGLGLAIARSYARAHGGDLIYEQRPGGPVFELIVPQG